MESYLLSSIYAMPLAFINELKEKLPYKISYYIWYASITGGIFFLLWFSVALIKLLLETFILEHSLKKHLFSPR